MARFKYTYADLLDIIETIEGNLHFKGTPIENDWKKKLSLIERAICCSFYTFTYRQYTKLFYENSPHSRALLARPK